MKRIKPFPCNKAILENRTRNFNTIMIDNIRFKILWGNLSDKAKELIMDFPNRKSIFRNFRVSITQDAVYFTGSIMKYSFGNNLFNKGLDSIKGAFTDFEQSTGISLIHA